ncbi:serine carboxypeptidase [Mycena metata]|uniref:Carboxypeptidase n=1 Tax=Mycena metata TaxID=1033252 RepID=A0AAD7MNT0_9AGAR|nr:serine carboxypeptidase [Mycena metata]
MLLPLLVSLTAVSSVFGAKDSGQFLVVDGVVGGVPKSNSFRTEAVQAEPLRSFTTTPGALRTVENSGVCETTPGVLQVSGYGDIAANQSIFFWYFAARNNPETAPLSLWFNGGPGSSSMLGLFQELGPCRITNDSSGVTLNPFSWNTDSNFLFIDQPVGVGWSHGTLGVNTSLAAAVDVWTFLQMFFADSRFSHLFANDLAIWTESYGGHYGPVFAKYFLDQNAAIESGTVSGQRLNLRTLGIGNGLTDGLTQYAAYIIYAKANAYQVPLVSADVIAQANTSWITPTTGCRDQIIACNNGGSDAVCAAAQEYCNDNILSPLAGNYDVYDVRSGAVDPYPPDLTTYLGEIGTQIGADVVWAKANHVVNGNFALTGDWMRTCIPELDFVINSGVRVTIYDGDADYIVNYYGVESMIAALNNKWSAEFNKQQFAPWTVGGRLAGQFKAAGGFSYVRIYEAGHEVPAYKNGTLQSGEAALQMFQQTMANKPLFST